MGTNWDVVVVGAGPGGSTVAALLASKGHRVCVLEKDAFPRFRIGESLLPACLPVLERLEIETTPDTFVLKRGAVFVCEETDREKQFCFAEALPGCPEHAWHVERSRFDLLLRDNARERGAEVRHGQAVADVRWDDDAVRVRTASGSLSARYLIDASGQGRFLARRMNGVEHDTRFGATSVYTHFESVSQEAYDSLGPNFEIRILLRPDGWGWVIPLPERRLSVGLVSRNKLQHEDLEPLLDGPLVERLTRGATRLQTHIAGNFSYTNTSPSGARYATVGDATCFLDPIFSSGVTLALRGAAALADILAPALDAGCEHVPELMSDHVAQMDRSHRTFAGLIHRFYHTTFAQSFFLGEMPEFEMRRGVMSVLAGDVWREDNPFQELLLKARRTSPKPVQP